MRRAVQAVLAASLLVLIAAPPARAATGWQWPLRGKVITSYRNGADPYARGQHRGIDIAGRVGDRVEAAAAGAVRFAGVAGSSGLTISIRTADGRYDTSYLHLSRAFVRKGRRVKAGDPIGAVGTSGRRSAVAPHLHFGVRRAGTRHDYVDPLDLLPPFPGPGRAPEPRGVPSPVPVRTRPEPRPAPVGAPRRVPVPRPTRVRVPGRAPSPRPVLVPRPAPSPQVAPRPRTAPSPRALPRTGPAPAPATAPGTHAAPHVAPAPHAQPAAGPDLGWALACAGLLLAAAFIGGSRGGEGALRGRGGAAARAEPMLARLQAALRRG